MILTGKKFPLGIYQARTGREQVNTCCAAKHADTEEEIVVFQPHNSFLKDVITHFPIGRFQHLFILKKRLGITGFEKDTMPSNEASSFVGLWKNKFDDDEIVRVCCISVSAKFEEIGRKIAVFQPHGHCCVNGIKYLPIEIFSFRFVRTEIGPLSFALSFEHPFSNCNCR